MALFAQEGYGAPCVLLGEGTHTSFGSVGNSNTRSIRVGAYMKVTLCDHGSIICNTFDGDDSNLMDNGIAQRTESAKVEWRFGPAGKPHTPNPANNAQLTYTTQVTLSVQGDGPEFQFELWTQNNTLIKNQSWSSSRSMTVTGLTPGVYHWRAEARNPRGPSGWTDWYFTIAPQNRPPVANAGSDQSVTDANGNGSESVTLNGSASSDPDGDALTYAWSEGSNSLATGAQPPVTLSVGVHTITLRVTDTKGASATDTVKVTVNEPASGTPVTLKLEVGIFDLTDPYPGFVAPSAYSPDHVDRELSVQVTDGSDQVVRDLNVTARFSASKQAFTADVVVNLEPGSYRVKVKLSNTLRRLQAGFFTVGSTATSITVPRIVTIVGDVDGNNQANIIDYNRLMGCYSDFEPPKSCSSSDQPGPSRQPTVDLNDDGFVNQFDYNLMLRVFNFQLGD